MIEAYRIGVSLIMETNVSGVLGTLLRDFERLNKSVQDARDGAKGLAGALRQVSGAGKDLASAAAAMDKMAKAMERMAAAGPQAAAGVAGMATASEKVAQNFQAATQAAQQAASAPIGGGGGGGGGPRLTGPGRPLLLGYDGGRFPVLAGGGGGFEPPGGVPAPLFPGPRQPINLPFPTRSSGPPLSMMDYTMAGIGASAVGAIAGSFVAGMYGEAAKIQHERAAMSAAGFSSPDVIRADIAARRIQQNVPGASYEDAMKVITEAKTFTGSAEEGIAAAPDLMKLDVVLRAQGKGDQMDELTAALQAGELRGALTKPGTQELDMGRLHSFLDNLLAADIATGGRVDARSFLQVMKSGGVYGAMLSDQGLFGEMIAPILSLGPAQAGTALQGFQMQFSAGKMSKAAAGELEEMGFLKPGKWKHVPIGQVWVDPGSIPELQNLREHPVQWIHDVLEPYLHKFASEKIPGFDLMTPQRQIQEEQNLAARITSRIPGGKFVGDIFRDWGMTSRYVEQFEAGKGRDPFAIFQGQDPNVHMKAFEDSWKALLAVLGDPNLGVATKSLDDIRGALNAMADFAKANPNIARVLFDVAAGLTAVGAVAGMVLLSVWPAMALAKVGGKAAGALGILSLGAGPRSAVGLSRLLGIGGAVIGGGASLYEQTDRVINGGGVLGGGQTSGLSGLLHSVNPWASGPDFNIWNRSTWNDPNGSVWTAAPKQPGPGSVNLRGDVSLDSKKVGSIVATGLADYYSRAPTGTTGYDLRVSPAPGGVSVQ